MELSTCLCVLYIYVFVSYFLQNQLPYGDVIIVEEEEKICFIEKHYDIFTFSVARLLSAHVKVKFFFFVFFFSTEADKCEITMGSALYPSIYLHSFTPLSLSPSLRHPMLSL